MATSQPPARTLATLWRSCRFKIAALVVPIVIVALIVIPICRSRRQARAVRQLHAEGAVVVYDYQVRGCVAGRILAPNAKVRPRLLSKVLGVDACHTVVGVQFGGGYFTDDGRRKMQLDFDYSEVTDDVLAVLGDLSSVKELYLMGCTEITDESMKHITQLKRLERLGLSHTHITDDGVLHLKSLKTLKFVVLPSATVTREGADELQRALPKASVIWSELPPHSKSK